MTGLVVDTSAVLAILQREAPTEALIAALDGADDRLMSAPTLVELGIVVAARYGPADSGIAERFIREGDVEVVPFDREQAEHGLAGWRRFGRGRHAAGLNLGDCLTYGLAVASELPILCVGDDFARTDVEVVSLDAPA